MRFASVALIAALLAGAPARSDYYVFTGALSFPEGSRRFLPRSGSVSGSGVAFSSVAPSNEIHLSVVNGFTGTLSTVFGSTAGYSQQAFLTQVGKGDFSDPGPGNLRGKLAVGGMGRRRGPGGTYAQFPFTTAGMTGLGLGGTLPAVKGPEPAVRFGTWTIGPRHESGVITTSMIVFGQFMYGTVSDAGFDKLTTMGMGAVQLVTPIRTVSGVPGDRAAFARLTLNFAPEPGRAALLLAGSTAVAVLGARRAARSAVGRKLPAPQHFAH